MIWAEIRAAAALAGILDGLERYDESEPIYRRVLAAFEQVYRPEHYENDSSRRTFKTAE